jgi:hypothetical protein
VKIKLGKVGVKAAVFLEEDFLMLLEGRKRRREEALPKWMRYG